MKRTGGEGTLGVVTKVSILVPAKLNSVNVAFLACEDFISCQVIMVLPFSMWILCLWNVSKLDWELCMLMYVAIFLHATACSKGSKVALGRNFIGIWVHRPACAWHGMCFYSSTPLLLFPLYMCVFHIALCALLCLIYPNVDTWWRVFVVGNCYSLSSYIMERNLGPVWSSQTKIHSTSCHRLKATFHYGYLWSG